MTVDQQSEGMPRWRQIEDVLMHEIGAGQHSREGRLPTEMALSERFGVNRHTVRRAMAGLAQRGLLRIEQGRGAFLVEDAIEYAVGPRTRFSENLLRQGRQPSLTILSARETPADGDMARWLRLRIGARVFILETRGDADGRTISLGRHCFPASRVPGFLEIVQEMRSISRALGRLGIANYRRARTRIMARPATVAEAQQLGIAPSRPLLVTESLNVDPRGRAIEYGTARFAADRAQLVVDTD
jgi:GntR family transcriptional regulator, phosphonate transport system regulatory protein